MPTDLTGWQSWSDCRRQTGRYPRRYFSPHKADNAFSPRSGISHLKSPPTGWCSWHWFGPHINEKVILTQAQAIRRLNLPLNYILIDDGWTIWGDWLSPGRQSFPHGLKWLVKKLSSLGFKSGIWWAPLLAKSSSVIFQKHPDWFIKTRGGNLLEGTQVSSLDAFIFPSRHVLDLQHPRTVKYLSSALDFFLDSGFELIKSDFLYANHFNPVYSSADIPDSLLHRFLSGIHSQPVFSLACGCPLAPAVGVVDAMRISDDINFPQLRLRPLSTLVIATRLRQLEANLTARKSTARFWRLDPDAFISDPALGITPAQSTRLAELIRQAEGLVFLGDNLEKIDPSRFPDYCSQLGIQSPHG